jgi:hypothetical protein
MGVLGGGGLLCLLITAPVSQCFNIVFLTVCHSLFSINSGEMPFECTKITLVFNGFMLLYSTTSRPSVR